MISMFYDHQWHVQLKSLALAYNQKRTITDGAQEKLRNETFVSSKFKCAYYFPREVRSFRKLDRKKNGSAECMAGELRGKLCQRIKYEDVR